MGPARSELHATPTPLRGNAARSSTDKRYLPGLDGLRAVAVLAVIGYHLGVPWLPGGYLGVDIFFVLSGFLITGLLLDEIQRTGRIDLVDFWRRRARRLLPALLAVLVVVSAYAAFVAQPAQRAQLRSDGFATLFYYANWHFIFGEQSYFAQYGDPSPLRHTWSLAIEEQWYVLLPLVLTGLLLLGLFSRRRVAIGLGLGALASAAWAAYLFTPELDPSRVYYGTDTRVEALLVGAVLACGTSRRVTGPHSRTYVSLGVTTVPLAAVVTPAAVAVLVGAMFLLPDSSPWLYRGGFLVVALATAAVIHASSSSGPTGRLLSWGPLRWIGLISYGLYLWHWPVIVILSSQRTGWTGWQLGAARLVVTFAVSALSYYLLEMPVRRGVLTRLGPTRWATGVAVLLAPAVVIAALFVATPPDPAALAAAGEGTSGQAAARASAQPNNSRLLVVGDSTAFNLAYPWSPEMTPHLSVTHSASLGCGFVKGDLKVDGTIHAAEAKCGTWPQDWAAAVERDSPDQTFLMAGAWELIDRSVNGQLLTVGSEEYAALLRSELDKAVSVLGARGAIVNLTTVPCYAQPAGGLDSQDLVTQRNDPARQRWLNDQLASYTRNHSSTVRLLDLRELLCDGDEPRPTVGGLSASEVRYDGVHFTPAGAALAWAWLAPRLEQGAPPEVGASRSAFFFGDSVPFQLRQNASGPVLGVTLGGATQLGCGVVNTPRVMNGALLPLPPQCAEWSIRWPSELRDAAFDVGVLWPGIGELFDHRVDGRTVAFGSAEGDQYLYDEYGRALDALATGGRPVSVVLMPCHGVSASQPESAVINDAGRIEHLNAVAAAVARERGAEVIDLNEFLCSDGYVEDREGVRIREDGLHFTPAGGKVVLDWLVPQLPGVTQG